MVRKQAKSRLVNSFLLACFIISLNLTLYAGPGNIAPLAKVSASVELNANYPAGNVTDGLIRIPGIGEWASNSRQNPWGGINYPWLQLNWDQK
jgi:hypothetical protein